MDITQLKKRRSKRNDDTEAAQAQSNGFLTRDQILAAEDIQTEVVSVDEWQDGGKLRVRGLSGRQRDLYQASLLVEPGSSEEVTLENATARLLAYCIVNEDGSRMFSEDDVAALGEKSGTALNRVYAVAQRLSGLTKQDMNELLDAQKKIPKGDSGLG